MMLTRFKRYLGAKLYRMFLWNEEEDDYMGFEEQGISYNDWQNACKKQVNLHYIVDNNAHARDLIGVCARAHYENLGAARAKFNILRK
jgi:hypothetical protein